MERDTWELIMRRDVLYNNLDVLVSGKETFKYVE